MRTNGFIDLQVNGFGGVDFSAPGLTVAAVRRVTRALAARGTAGFCPTLVSAPAAIYETNLPVLARALREPDLAPHLLGIHRAFHGPLDPGLDPRAVLAGPGVLAGGLAAELNDRQSPAGRGLLNVHQPAPAGVFRRREGRAGSEDRAASGGAMTAAAR